mmetsp:Transcript_26734/g.55528  ORF Transcript_26734/g.55528 Transcript_26734/m.55528 type:complete len:122 (-) Transcript_26734:25-390(-)
MYMRIAKLPNPVPAPAAQRLANRNDSPTLPDPNAWLLATRKSAVPIVMLMLESLIQNRIDSTNTGEALLATQAGKYVNNFPAWKMPITSPEKAAPCPYCCAKLKLSGITHVYKTFMANTKK